MEIEKLTASKLAKRCGLKSLNEMAELNNVTRMTLDNWFNEDRGRFVDALHTAARKKVERAVESESVPKSPR